MKSMSSAAAFRQLDVLVCEPDDVYFEQLKEALAIADLFRNCIRAKNGTEALTKLGNQQFGLVIVELDLEKPDALGLLNQIKNTSVTLEQNKNANFIVTYKAANNEAFEQMKSLGVDTFFPKPFVTESFIEKMIESLGL